ncbi:hypothetical protein Pst134EA_032008 [Puccinia striiformis f. sp. tritici]|uniref:uncharacterized protein n=1 Tax=Puccinia striiformis f. sp. tritici TaxID=168172 RepID=UPI00200765EB|nr:uncharacterized protein Pst134EA_032008 [Puccinia striiformis f. sp. tritici]KAH9441965.1 hypothetical protein Pst134EA_032008 [Puccinia striiformis f. sp. tritici]
MESNSFRLTLMLRRSGKNIFTGIKPIDIEGAIHQTDAHSFFLDLDLEEEEEDFLRRPNNNNNNNKLNNINNNEDSVPFLQQTNRSSFR